MICPFCGKSIPDNTMYCPECGQSINNKPVQKDNTDFWNSVNKEDLKREKQYKDLVEKESNEKRVQVRKQFFTIIMVCVVVAVSVLGFLKYQSYSKKMTDNIKQQLIGQTLTAHSDHMEGLGWIKHEYWQLTFKDESNLDYAYIKTTGLREKDEVPEYKGTYNYSISRSVTGGYSVRTNGTTYKLYVNDNNIPTGISRK